MTTIQKCYPALMPIRMIICITTLISFIAVSIGKKLSQDTMSSIPNSDIVNNTTIATEEFFDDTAHFAINITVLVNMLIMIFYPRSTFWWLLTSFRRLLFALVLSSLGFGYGIRLLIEIQQQGGCRSQPYFNWTRTRCWVQYGVTSCEIIWGILLIIECVVNTRQKRDIKWQDQMAEVELRSSVLYRPDLSLGVDGSNNNNNSQQIENNNIQMNAIGGNSEQGFDHVDEDVLPEYTRRRPRDQPRIVDATNPPQRLAGAVARQIQAEETPNITQNSQLEPPSFSSAVSSSAAAAVYIADHENEQEPQEPPPSYQPHI